MDPVNPAVHEISSVKPLQLSAPQNSVEHFNSLLTGKTRLFESTTPALNSRVDSEKNINGTLLEDTAKRLNKAEVALEELSWEIRKSAQPLDNKNQLSSELIHTITEMKYKTTAYFMNMMRTESGFSSLSEETESITRRRG